MRLGGGGGGGEHQKIWTTTQSVRPHRRFRGEEGLTSSTQRRSMDISFQGQGEYRNSSAKIIVQQNAVQRTVSSPIRRSP
jgi:ribosomal protein L21E